MNKETRLFIWGLIKLGFGALSSAILFVGWFRSNFTDWAAFVFAIVSFFILTSGLSDAKKSLD